MSFVSLPGRRRDPHFRLLQRRRQRLEQEDQNSELFENFPIHMVESWDNVVEVMDFLKGLPEAKVIGIDTEWAPAFLTTTERYLRPYTCRELPMTFFRLALIQISNGKKAYLVDVVALEAILTQEQWLQFFDALFCRSFMKVGKHELAMQGGRIRHHGCRVRLAPRLPCHNCDIPFCKGYADGAHAERHRPLPPATKRKIFPTHLR